MILYTLCSSVLIAKTIKILLCVYKNFVGCLKITDGNFYVLNP